MINAHFRALGMGWTAHQLRHRFATRVHDASGDLLVTQALLGHASPTTTAIYAKFSSPRAVEAVRKVA
jgi:site-specific recombinase XerC